MAKFLRNTEVEIDGFVEIISNTLYFAILKGSSPMRRVKYDGDLFFFTTDEELLYQNFYYDFGPLNISCLYKYCCKLNKYLQYARGVKKVVHYTCSHPDKKANAAFLIGAYCVIYLKIQPEDMIRLLQGLGPFKPFLDASQFACQFTLKMIDCYQAIAKAITFNFFNFDDFNASEYDLYNKLEYGDINWLVPRKFLAFIGPAENKTSHPPEFYIKYFLKNDVKTVIRLNNILYDPYTFMQAGIQHYDLIFPDGTTPPKEILLKFLYLSETAPAAIAVHCKAGLGRTGSLIGAYLIKHYRMTAREAIGWLRICRPGSVIGQQQIWLEKIQSWLWRVGSQYRLQHYGEGDKIPLHKYGIYSKLWPLEREKYLRQAKQNVQSSFIKAQTSSVLQVQRKKHPTNSKRMLGHESKLFPSSGDNFKDISKLLSSVHGLSQHELKNPNPSQIKAKKSSLIAKPINSTQGDQLNEIKVMRQHRSKIQKPVIKTKNARLPCHKSFHE